MIPKYDVNAGNLSAGLPNPMGATTSPIADTAEVAKGGGAGVFGPIAAGVSTLAGLQESSKQKSLQPLASSLLMTALLFA